MCVSNTSLGWYMSNGSSSVPNISSSASSASNSPWSSFSLYQIGPCSTSISTAFVASYPVLIASYLALTNTNAPPAFLGLANTAASTTPSPPSLAMTTCSSASVWYVNFVNAQQVEITTFWNGQWWFVLPQSATVSSGQSLVLTSSPPSSLTASSPSGAYYIDSTMQTSQTPQVYNAGSQTTGGWGVTFEAPASSYAPGNQALFYS
ncbi:hypothetical protein EBZ80_25460 [bacterium]|nr:hypothetical protein [bacterium]